ncbi:MAG: hypothetical protein ACI97A_002790 [Planctomycetota bacterium]|jgi:hypothetical protein
MAKGNPRLVLDGTESSDDLSGEVIRTNMTTGVHIFRIPCLAWIMIFAVVLAYPLPAQVTDPAIKAVAEAVVATHDQEAPDQITPQEVIDELRKNRDPYYTIYPSVLEMWKKEAMQPRLVRLFQEENLPSNVFTAIALVFGKVNERSSLPTLLRALVSGRLKETSETIRLHGLQDFDEFAPIYPEIKDLIKEFGQQKVDGPRTDLVNLLALIPGLVQLREFKEERSMAADRYFAIDMLLTAWATEKGKSSDSGPVGVAFASTLSQLVDGALNIQTQAQWNNWFSQYRQDKEVDQRLLLAQVYSDLVTDLRSKNLKLEQKRRTEVAALIKRMRATGEPPTRFLLDEDASLRRMSSVTFKSMSDSLGDAQRTTAIVALTEILNRKDLDEELYRELLNVAGPLGKKSPPDEKKALIVAIFDSRQSTQPQTWQARLKAASAIGLLDDEKRIASIYAFANVGERKKAESWSRVRIDVIRLAQELSVGFDFISLALDDADPDVRGVAAVILSVASSTLTEETVDRLLLAASKEQDQGALTRMLQSAETIVKKKPETLSLAALENVLSIEFSKVEPVTQARLSLVLIAASKQPKKYTSATDAIIKLIDAVVNVETKALQSELIKTIVDTPCSLVTPTLIKWLASPENHAKSDWRKVRDAVVADVEQSKTWPRDIIGLWDLCVSVAKLSPEDAGMTSMSVVMAAQNFAELPEALSLDTMRTAHEEWSLASSSKNLWINVLELREKDVENAKDDRRLLASLGALRERLAMVWSEKRGELLKDARGDHQKCLEKNGADESEAQQVFHHLAVARIAVLLLDFDGAKAALAEAGGEAAKALPASLINVAIDCLRTPGSAAVAKLEVIPEERRVQAPLTIAWLTCAANALSPDMADWRKAMEGVPSDASVELKQRLKERVGLVNKLERIIKARIEGKEAPAEKELVPNELQLLTTTLARRALAIYENDASNAEKLTNILVAISKNKKLGWPTTVSSESMASWAAVLGTLTIKVTIDENLREVFLSPVGSYLYSLD